MNRVITGIKSLDEVIGGGFPHGTNVLIAGASGTGKTIFCAQFLFKGVKDYGENGIFVTLEERPEDLRNEMLSFGWDFKKFENKEKLIILDAASPRLGLYPEEKHIMPRNFNIDTLITEIRKISNQIDAKRLVIDSIPSIELRVSEISQIRWVFYRLTSFLLEMGITSLLTTESLEPHRISRYGVEEFLCRGVITLDLEEDQNTLKRFMRVRKMRGIKHTMRKLPFEIERDGIIIYHLGE